MLEWKIRGYVTPEDFEGSDGEKIQKALDYAKKEDICRVVLKGTYRAEQTITVPDHMHFVLDGATLYGNLQNEIVRNFSLVSERIYLEGKGGKIVGNLYFCHTDHLILENMEIAGDLRMDFCIYPRAEHLAVSGALTLGRGCQGAILQDIRCRRAAISGEDGGYDVIGRDPMIKNILLRDSEIKEGAVLKAAEDCAFLNVQIDGICSEKTCIVVGEKGVALPKEQYQNMTFADLTAPEKVVFLNETEHTSVY